MSARAILGNATRKITKRHAIRDSDSTPRASVTKNYGLSVACSRGVTKLQQCTVKTLLSLTLLSPVIITGCAVHAGFYDADHRDYHRWRGDEQPHFDAWVADTHHSRVSYENLDDRDKQAYWNWRHDHP